MNWLLTLPSIVVFPPLKEPPRIVMGAQQLDDAVLMPKSERLVSKSLMGRSQIRLDPVIIVFPPVSAANGRMNRKSVPEFPTWISLVGVFGFPPTPFTRSVLQSPSNPTPNCFNASIAPRMSSFSGRLESTEVPFESAAQMSARFASYLLPGTVMVAFRLFKGIISIMCSCPHSLPYDGRVHLERILSFFLEDRSYPFEQDYPWLVMSGFLIQFHRIQDFFFGKFAFQGHWKLECLKQPSYA